MYWYEVVAVARRVILLGVYQAVAYRGWLMVLVCAVVFAIHESMRAFSSRANNIGESAALFAHFALIMIAASNESAGEWVRGDPLSVQQGFVVVLSVGGSVVLFAWFVLPSILRKPKHDKAPCNNTATHVPGT